MRAAWEDAVTDGKDIPEEHAAAGQPGAAGAVLGDAGPRMVIPSAPSRAQGTDDFFQLCHILSLAPEWYPEGLVNMNYPAHGTALIRPVSFDGMLSPLWVQRPPEQARGDRRRRGGRVQPF